jgi:hypothetical protein
MGMYSGRKQRITTSRQVLLICSPGGAQVIYGYSIQTHTDGLAVCEIMGTSDTGRALVETLLGTASRDVRTTQSIKALSVVDLDIMFVLSFKGRYSSP